MSKHYTRQTVSVSKWCNKCKGNTQHRVTDRRVNDCLECIERLDVEHKERVQRITPAAPENRQGLLW